MIGIIQKKQPAPPEHIAGSFIVVDESSRKLSDLGLYKKAGGGRNQAVTGSDGRSANLTARKARFETNF